MKYLYLTLLSLCISLPLSAQNTGSIQGTVKTSDGDPAAHVNVTIEGSSRGDVADDEGRYRITHIKPGTYTLVVSFVGLETQTRSVEVKATENITVDFVLRENAQELETVVVQGTVEKGYTPEREVSSSLRIQTTTLETPQSILVINKDIIADQQIFTTTDITKNVSGVTSIYPYVNIYTDFNIRGTRAYTNRLRNGMPITASYGTLQEDMAYVESVEFIKGPAGFMLAQGEPGGMYNVVTKKPLNKNHVSAGFSTGSYGLFRATTDFGGRVNNKLFYRVNVVGQKSGTHLDYGVNNRLSFAPVIRYEFTDKTSLTAELNYDVAENNGSFTNLPSMNRKFLRRSFAIDDPVMDPVKLNNSVATINLQHHINDNWKLTAQAGFLSALQDGAMFFAGTWVGLIDDDGMLPRAYRYMVVKNSGTTGQFFLNGDVNTGSVNHKILIGIDGAMYEDKWKSADVYGVLPLDIHNPVYGLGVGIDTLVDESSLPWDWPSRTMYQAIAVQDNIQLNAWLQLTVGGRYTFHQYGYLEKMERTNKFTPRAALLIKPMENTSVYFLYDQSFIPQSGQSFEGDSFEPLTGNNLEVGVKREWFRNRLFTQLAAYSIIKNNALASDPQNPGFSIQRGQVKSKGVELDIAGSVNENLSVIANYAYTNAKITEDPNSEVVGTRENAPVHTINVWLKYKITKGMLNGFGAGIGGSYYKDQYGWTVKKNPDDPQMTYDFKSLNAALYYTTGGLSISVNIDNITDVYNIIFGGFDYNLGTNGEYDYISLPGRNVRLGVNYKF